MHVPRGLAIAVLPLGVVSQIITITERPSACSAIYTSGTSSVTVVQSTVTVAPIPFSDALVNGGAPFVIEIQPGTPVRRRQSERSTYINASGRTTTNATDAVVYRILNGTLQSSAGGFVSAEEGADSALFAISAIAKAISTTFFSRDLAIGWNNSAFAGGACEFYTAPADDGNLDVIAYFRGTVDSSWLACTFAVQPAGGLILEPATSTSVSTIISMPGGVTTTPATRTSTGQTSTPTPPSNTTNGYCGSSAGVCDGVIFGSCCSQYGACGNTDEYCGAGCLSDFGVCSPVVPSSSATAGSSGAGPSPPTYSATAPQPATSSVALSSIAPATSTSVYISTSGSVVVTMTTMVPVSTTLPTYSVPGTPIGPINPPMLSSSTPATSSIATSSSPSLPSSDQTTPSPAMSSFVGISSVPAVSVPSSTDITVSMPGSSSTASSGALTNTVSTNIGAGTLPPTYSASDAASSSPAVSITSSVPVSVSSSSVSIPLPSFYSSPVLSVSSAISSVTVTPVYSTDPTSSSTVPISPVSTSCPGASDGSVLIDSRGEAYNIYCDSDYSGNLATPIPDTPSFDACLLLCDNTEGCAAATWVRDITYCYLKPAGGFLGGTGGYVGVRVLGPVAGSSSSVVVVTSTPSPETSPTTASTPALPTEESMSAVFTTTLTPIPEYSSTAPIPVFSSTAIPDTSSSISSAPVSSSTSLPVPVLSSTSVPETYPSATSTDETPSSTSVLVLPSPTRCDFGDPPDYGSDDSYCEITLPQPMVLYGKSSVNTFASSNGVLSILFGTGQYENAATLPTTQVTEADNVTPLTALFPFWDDLAVPEGTSDYGIYYQLSDAGVTYEYYLTRSGRLVLFHFTVEYAYANPGVATFTYYEMDDPGDAATVGAQGFDATDTAVGALYSYQTGTITTGLVIVCDTLQNTCVRSPSSA